jgi:putative spermidine/putrescine transport system substrate-binding protein
MIEKEAIPQPPSRGRRTLLKAGAAAAGVVLGAPLARAQHRGKVIVRSLGGAYDAAMKKALHLPFTEATGIDVVLQTASAGQVRAMVQSGRGGLDVVDIGLPSMVAFDADGILQPLAYDRMTYTRPQDIYDSVRKPNYVGSLYFATVLVYNTQAYSKDHHPTTWAEFWDLKTWPGPRTIASQSAGSVPLEFAMLAAGKPMNKIYPVDLNEAYASLAKVKPGVVKWWDTGAISAQLLERKEAVLGAVWNGRAQDLIDKGAPLAIEWNQARREVQGLGVVKGAPNAANAQKYIDFALQPTIQAELTRYIAYGPTNRAALPLVKPEDAEKLPSVPEHYDHSFDMDYAWWQANLAEVGKRWQVWILQG